MSWSSGWWWRIQRSPVFFNHFVLGSSVSVFPDHCNECPTCRCSSIKVMIVQSDWGDPIDDYGVGCHQLIHIEKQIQWVTTLSPLHILFVPTPKLRDTVVLCVSSPYPNTFLKVSSLTRSWNTCRTGWVLHWWYHYGGTSTWCSGLDVSRYN